MARVVFPDHLSPYTGEVRELDVDASSFRELVVALEARFPGIATALHEKVTVAIDGEISHDPFLEPLQPGSEVHFLFRISGG
jgi:molybdopterin converting factor small subunit